MGCVVCVIRRHPDPPKQNTGLSVPAETDFRDKPIHEPFGERNPLTAPPKARQKKSIKTYIL